MAPPLKICCSAACRDRTAKFWDLQSSTPAAVVNLPERAYSMDTRGAMMVVGTADKKVEVYLMGRKNNMV